MKTYKVNLKIVAKDCSVDIEHSDYFIAKSKEEAEKKAIDKARKDLTFNCTITVLKSESI